MFNLENMRNYFFRLTGVLLSHLHSGHIQSNLKLRSGTVTNVYIGKQICRYVSTTFEYDLHNTRPYVFTKLLFM